MRPVGGLGFDRWIPPWVEVNHGIGASEVQADAAGLEADQKDGKRIVALETVDDFAAVGSRAIEEGIGDFLGFKPLANKCQHAHELAEDQHTMAAVDDLLEQFAEKIEFAGSGFRIRLLQLQQPQVATNLPQAQ